MTKKDKEKVEAFGGIGVLIIIIGFMAGVVLTGIGGGWETMKESFTIMALYIVSQFTIVFGIAYTTVCAIIFNKIQ